MIYLDSSALFKQYYQEPGSERVRQIFLEAKRIATASLSYAEVFSALNRKLREKAIDGRQYQKAAGEFDGDWRHLHVVPLSPELLIRARLLLERHELRAGDAVQLASASIFPASTPLEFVSADRRLTEAARVEGISSLLL